MDINSIISDCDKISQGFYSNKLAQGWRQALVSGNGKMGAMVMSHPYKETIICNHEQLFLPIFSRRELPDLSNKLPYIRDLISCGNYQKAAEFVADEVLKYDYPYEMLMTDPFHPAFDLLIDMGRTRDYKNYKKYVDFSTGETFVTWQDETATYIRRLFVSRADNVIVMAISANTPVKKIRLQLGPRPTMMEAQDRGKHSSGYIRQGSYFQTGINYLEINADKYWLTYRSGYAKNEGGYEGLARVKARDGNSELDGNEMIIKDSNDILVMLDITPLEDINNSKIEETKKRLLSLPDNYNSLLARHVKIHGDMFSRVKLDLGDLKEEKKDELAAEDLMESSRNEFSMNLLEKAFAAARYNILCSTGELPPNLQGVWGGTWNPYWSGDFTLDANVEAAIAHMLVTNLPESMKSFFNLIESMKDDMRENARRMFGCRGFLANSRASNHGVLQRFNRGCPIFFWTAGAAWFAHYYYDYYLFTGDKDFLRERALPFMKEAILFYEDFMIEDEKGQYQFIPSYSPENTPANSNSQVSKNATMDIAAVKELLRNLINTCEELKIESEEQDNIDKWKQMLAKMSDYMANKDGALKEWNTPDLEDNYAHRHMSHLYPLYPGLEITPDGNPELFKMCERAVAKRLEQDDLNVHTGFGLYHVSLAASRCRNGELAFTAIRHLVNYYFHHNFMTSHDRGPSGFNVDASGGLPAAVIEMLVISQPGQLDLLPALPEELNKGKISGIRARKQLHFEELVWNLNKNEVSLKLKSEIKQKVTVKLPFSIERVIVNEEVEELVDANSFVIDTEEHKLLEIKISLYNKGK